MHRYGTALVLFGLPILVASIIIMMVLGRIMMSTRILGIMVKKLLTMEPLRILQYALIEVTESIFTGLIQTCAMLIT